MIMTVSVCLSTFTARRASQGMAMPLSRGATQSVSVDKLTRRASLWCPATALQHSTREWAIAFALRLAAEHHRDAESVIIMLTEHQSLLVNQRGYYIRSCFYVGATGNLDTAVSGQIHVNPPAQLNIATTLPLSYAVADAYVTAR